MVSESNPKAKAGRQRARIARRKADEAKRRRRAEARIVLAVRWAEKNRVEVIRAAIDPNRLEAWRRRDPVRFPRLHALADRIGNCRMVSPDLDGEDLLPPLGECLRLGRAVIVSGHFEKRGGEPDPRHGWRFCHPDGSAKLWTRHGSIRYGLAKTNGLGFWLHPDGRQWVPDPDPFAWILRLLATTAAAQKDGMGVPALVEVVEAIRGWDRGGIVRFPSGLVDLRFAERKADEHRMPSLVWPAPTAPPEPEPRPGFLPFGGGATHPGGPGILPALAAFDWFGGVSMRNGRGAPHEARLAVFVLSGLTPEARRGGFMLPQYFEAERLAAELWNDIPRGGRAIRALRAGLDAMSRLEAGRVILPDTRSSGLRPLMISAMPASLEDSVEVFVRLPPGDGRGFLYDRERARELAMIAAPPWRLYFAACWLRDRFATRGRGIELTVPEVQRGREGVILDAEGNPVIRKGVPVFGWWDAKAVPTGKRIRNEAADRLPVYSLDDLTRAACGLFLENNPSTRRTRRVRTIKALEFLRKAGDLDYETATDANGRGGYRIAAVDPRRRRALLRAGTEGEGNCTVPGSEE